ASARRQRARRRNTLRCEEGRVRTSLDTLQVRTDPSPHFRARSVQVRLQFRHGETGDLGDLLVALLLKNLQREDRSLVLVEARERPLDDAVQLLVEQSLLGSIRRVQLGE